jgi:hypothetical protein
MLKNKMKQNQNNSKIQKNPKNKPKNSAFLQTSLIQSKFILYYSAPKKGIYHIYNEKNYRCNLDVRGVFGVKINRAENGNAKFLQLPKLQITPRYKN